MVAGPGDSSSVIKKLKPEFAKRIKFLGRLSEEEKVEFFKSISLYVAPNTGGESFGIILAEAMTCGTPILASDLPAFRTLLDSGSCGGLFKSENSESLAVKAIDILKNDSLRNEISRLGFEKAKSFDWETVGEQILSVYDLALTGNSKIKLNSEGRIWNRVRTND